LHRRRGRTKTGRREDGMVPVHTSCCRCPLVVRALLLLLLLRGARCENERGCWSWISRCSGFEVLRRVWMLKLRACGSTARVNGGLAYAYPFWTWSTWSSWSKRRGCKAGREYWALAVREWPPSLLSPHKLVHLHLEQLDHLPCSSQCEHHQSSSSYAPYGPMHDDCADVHGGSIYMNRLISGTSDFGDGDSQDRNDRDQRRVHVGLGHRRCCWRPGKEVWEAAEFWVRVRYKVVHFC